MKLQSLEVSGFRRFNGTVRLDALGPGMNVIGGANESGKSTLVEALRVAFLEQSTSNAQRVKSLTPHASPNAKPSVAVTFTRGDEKWDLRKQFLAKSATHLNVDGRIEQGEAADVRIAALLGHEYRGGLELAPLGISGLLWVMQGSAADLTALSEPWDSAGGIIREAVTQLAGQVAAEGGDEMLRRIDQLSGAFWTTAGKARGNYATAQQALEAIAQTTHSIENQLRALEQDQTALSEALDRERAGGDDAAISEADTTIAKLDVILNDIAPRQALLHQQEQRQLGARREQGLLLQQISAELDQLTQRAELKERLKQTVALLQQCGDELQQQKTHLVQYGSECKIAETRQAQAQDQRRRSGLQREYEDVLSRHHALEQQLQQAVACLEQIGSLQQVLASNDIAPETVGRLRTLEAELSAARQAMQTQAPQIHWSVVGTHQVHIDGEDASCSGERAVERTLTWAIPGMAEVTVIAGTAPGVEAIDRLETTMREALTEAGVVSSKAAEDRLQRWQTAERDRQRLALRMETWFPEGRDEAQANLTMLAARLRSLTEERDSIPAEEAPMIDVEQAVIDVTRAVELREAAAQRVEELRQQHSDLQQRKSGEEGALAMIPAGEDDDSVRRREELDQAVKDLSAQVDKDEVDISALKVALAEVDVDSVTADRKRHADILRSAQEQRTQRGNAITKLRARLELQGGQELSRQLADAESEKAAADARLNVLSQRADALKLLADTMHHHRQNAVDALQAPLRTRLEFYLGMVWGAAGIGLDGSLLPETVQRDGQALPVEKLSVGAREQLTVIARLAYADMLKEGGHPTLIVLDDALVNTDANRREGMCRALYDAAQRHQILFFTCEPDSWRGLGVPCRRIEEMHV